MASKAELQAEIAALRAQLASPASAKAGAPTFYTRAQVKAGTGFPCTAQPACGRVLSTSKRAAIHGVAEGGHTAR